MIRRVERVQRMLSCAWPLESLKVASLPSTPARRPTRRRSESNIRGWDCTGIPATPGAGSALSASAAAITNSMTSVAQAIDFGL